MERTPRGQNLVRVGVGEAFVLPAAWKNILSSNGVTIYGLENITTSDWLKTGLMIGPHVWIGSSVTVLKGAVIPDGCVIAAGSVVCSKFEMKNALIAGNPARVIRENISWE